MSKKGLGTYVSERRKELGLTQNDLAKALGYTAQGISKFESGESQIAILVLPKLANLFNESLDDLLNEVKEPAPLKDPNPQVENANLVANIIALRSQHNLSQAKEAEILKVSKRSIINYEQGESYPSIDTLLAILAYYKISAKSFYFDKLSPLPVSQIHYRDPRKKLNPLWISLIAFGAIALTVGCTSPLWSGYLQRAKTLTGNSSLESASSSANSLPSSATSSSSESSLSSDASSSSKTVFEDPDLSPYLPGLKQVFVQTADGIAGSVTLQPGSRSLTFFSGSFVFNEANQDTYGFTFFLDGAPTGVTLTKDSKIYDYVTLYVPSSVSDGATFNVGIKVFAKAHEDEPVTGIALGVKVSLNTSKDLSADFPGLKEISLSIDGSTNKTEVTPGEHSVSILCSPENYFTEHGVTAKATLLTRHDGVVLSGNTLSIADYVSDSFGSLILLTLTMCDKTYNDQGFNYSVINPSGELNSDDFPGITSFDVTINGSYNATLAVGETQGDVSLVKTSRCTFNLDPSHFVIYATFHTGSNYDGFSITTTGTDLSHCVFSVPATIADQSIITVSANLAKADNRALYLTAKNLLYLTFSNPSA